MKKVFVWFFTIVSLGFLAFVSGRYYQNHRDCNQNEGQIVWNNGFRPARFPLSNSSFVIFICGSNNGAFVEKMFRSIFSQCYENVRIIYIDDASTDGSFDLAYDCISHSSFASKTIFIHNEQKMGWLANLLRAIQNSTPQEIIICLRDRDLLAHEWVLQSLNQYYSDPDLWMTYGQYVEFPSYCKGNARNYLQSEVRQFRQAPFLANHLPTFRTGLLKKIRENDLRFQGSFFPQEGELAVILPMLEMARDHFQFIPEILTISMDSSFLSEKGSDTARWEQYIRALEAYSPILNIECNTEEPKSEA